MNTICTLTQPAVHVPMQQPAYFAGPPGPNPAGALNVTYAGAVGIQVLYFYFIHSCFVEMNIIVKTSIFLSLFADSFVA